MNAQLSVWDKLCRVVIFFLFVAGLLSVFFWYLPLIQKNERYRRDILALDGQIAQEEKRAHQLKASTDAAKNDPRTVERMAREILGLAKTNETVFRFEAPAAGNAMRR